MNLKTDFSYVNYEKILEKYFSSVMDYNDALSSECFTLIRHDVEFDVARALEMAKIDNHYGAQSSFLFQVRSNAYNILSQVNTDIIWQIKEMGLHVGLHLYVTHIAEEDWATLDEELSAQKTIMEKGLGFKIDRFSFHRPPDWILKNRNDIINGLLNLYGKSFFEYTETPKNPKFIKYLADSRHRWDYGDPLGEHDYKKFHLMVHPDEWSNEALAQDDNFKKLQTDNSAAFQNTLRAETKNFSEIIPKND